MKQCPVCSSIYSDATLNFCLQDGSPLTGPHDTDQTVLMTTGEKPTINLPSASNSSPKPSLQKRHLAMSGVLILLVAGVISLAIYYPSAPGPVSSPAVQPAATPTPSPGNEPVWIPLTQVADNKIRVSYALVGQTLKLKFINDDPEDVKIKYWATAQVLRNDGVWGPWEYPAEVKVRKHCYDFDNYPQARPGSFRDLAVKIIDWEYLPMEYTPASPATNGSPSPPRCAL